MEVRKGHHAPPARHLSRLAGMTPMPPDRASSRSKDLAHRNPAPTPHERPLPPPQGLRTADGKPRPTRVRSAEPRKTHGPTTGAISCPLAPPDAATNPPRDAASQACHVTEPRRRLPAARHHVGSPGGPTRDPPRGTRPDRRHPKRPIKEIPRTTPRHPQDDGNPNMTAGRRRLRPMSGRPLTTEASA
jgi:hypothetical protein